MHCLPFFTNKLHFMRLRASTHEQDVIRDLRDYVLFGKIIAFSRVFPMNVNNEQQFLWQSAIACGAKCQDKVTPDVTHLVTTSGDTDKCREAMKLPSTFIVNVDWLVEAVMKWHLVDESDYQIPGCERRIPSFLLTAQKRERPQSNTEECDEPPEKVHHEENDGDAESEDNSQVLEFLQMLGDGASPDDNNS